MQIFLIIIFLYEVKINLLRLFELSTNDYEYLFADLASFVNHLVHHKRLFLYVVLKLGKVESIPVMKIWARLQERHESFDLLGLDDAERLLVVFFVHYGEKASGVWFNGSSTWFVV